MHPLVKEFYGFIPEEMSLAQFCKYHRLNENTVRTWRRTANPVSPSLTVFDDILNRIGYKLTITRK